MKSPAPPLRKAGDHSLSDSESEFLGPESDPSGSAGGIASGKIFVRVLPKIFETSSGLKLFFCPKVEDESRF